MLNLKSKRIILGLSVGLILVISFVSINVFVKDPNKTISVQAMKADSKQSEKVDSKKITSPNYLLALKEYIKNNPGKVDKNNPSKIIEDFAKDNNVPCITEHIITPNNSDNIKKKEQKTLLFL